jgi:tRNA(Leu) C34 or U34 (ribose-2'-O)-methylase TrmL
VQIKGRIERTDPRSTHRHVPVQWLPNVLDGLPHECEAVAVEIAQGATPLPDFKHPERAFYIFGAEDTGIPGNIIAVCDHVISVPVGSLNLAATVNVILYDRLAKRRLAA